MRGLYYQPHQPGVSSGQRPPSPRSVAASERETLLPGIKQRLLHGWLFGVIIIPLFLEDLDISYMSVPLFPPLLLPVG